MTGNVEAEETATGSDLGEVTIDDSGDQSLDRSYEPEADQAEIQTASGFFRKPGTMSETTATASRPSRPSMAEGSRRPALTATSQSDRGELEPQTQVSTTSLAPVGAPRPSNMANVTMEVNALLNRVIVCTLNSSFGQILTCYELLRLNVARTKVIIVKIPRLVLV